MMRFKNNVVSVYAEKKGFIVNDDKLVEVTNIEFEIAITEEKMKVAYALDVTGVGKINKSDFDLFASSKDYENGRKLGKVNYGTNTLFSRPRIKANREVNGEYINIEVYTYNGKIAEQLDADKAYFVSANDGVYFVINGNKYTCDNTYDSVEDCYKTNDYHVILADGTEEVHGATDKPYMLTEEMEDALKKVRDAMKAARELGVEFMYDYNDNVVYAYNGKSVTIDNEYNYCGDERDEMAEKIVNIDKYLDGGFGDINYFGDSSEYHFYRKD